MRRIRFAAALGALTVVATMAVPGGASAAPGDPALVHGKKAGPVAIPVQQRTVASLPLTKGRWLVMAKAVIAGTGGSSGTHLGVDCRLHLGSRTDLVTAVPTWDDIEGSRLPILLTTAGKLKNAGNALLKCAAEVGGTVKIRDIRITAIKVGTLTTRSTLTPAGGSFGPSATSGSGKPVVVTAKQGSPQAVTGNGALHPVANLPLSQGRWWIIAKGVADDGATSTSYLCGIQAGGDGDLTGFPLGTPGTASDAHPFAIQVVHDFVSSSGSANLVCQGNADFRVRNVVINAIKVGTLTNEFRAAVTTGSGTPRVISGWNDGPISVPVGATFTTTLTTRPLPKGKWLVFVKAWFEADGVPSDITVRRLECQLGFSGVKDDVQLRYRNNVSRVGNIVLQVPDSTQGGQSGILRCRRSNAGGTGDMLWVKMTAIRLKSITPWPL